MQTHEPVDILVVDDERVNLKILEGVLRSDDINIITAMTGEEALQRIEERDFALVLLDVMMPGLDGFSTAERIRAREATSDMPIIFVTAISKEQKHVFKGYELGAVDYLFKPVEPEILQSKVNVFIRLHRQKLALIESEERYRTVADYNWDWETWVAPGGDVLYMSPSCERISGYSPQRFIESPGFLEKIIHTEDLMGWKGFMADELHLDAESHDFRIRHKDGDLRWLSLVKQEVRGRDDTCLGMRCSMRDITKRKEMEIQLRHHQLHDSLTQLANRYLLMDRVQRAFARTSKQGAAYAVVFLGLDRFKVINDSLGHAFGDKLLVEVGRRLADCVRGGDMVSRFSGDEFVLFMEDLDGPSEAYRLVSHVSESLREPFHIEGHEIKTSASLGVVLQSDDHKSPEEIIQKANIAMYRAKESGRDQYNVFDPNMLERAVRQLKLENEIRRAIAEREFTVAYQPIVDLSNSKVKGFEALARWEHPQDGTISPGEFIPIAEDTGMIIDLGMLVLEQACTDMAGWMEKYPEARDVTVSVNLSGRQFGLENLAGDIRGVLQRTGLPSRNLKLEITETTIMDDVQASAAKLSELRDEGITLAIDDFGTGYSSLSYLQKLPLDHLKVDLSFVQQMVGSHENIEIVRAIINLAHSLRLKCVAEGIETQEQKGLLYSMQCEFGQGYLFSRPMPPEDIPAFFESSL